MSKKKEETKEDQSKEKETVEIPKESYKQLMSKMKDMEQKQEILMQTANKKSMARYLEQHKEDQPQIMKLGKLNGKVIVGWKTEKNEVGKDENGNWFEEQYVRIIFDDGSDRLMEYRNFVQTYTKFECKRVGVKHDEEEDKIFYTLESLDEDTLGKTYEVEAKFVNP